MQTRAERALRTLLVLLVAIVSSSVTKSKELDVELRTPTGTLFGTLEVPATTGKLPVALLIPGSGPTDRDGNGPIGMPRSDTLRLLSRGLAKFSIATLRFDKRGVGASVGAARAEEDLRFDTYVADAQAWIEQLKRDPRFSAIAVIGHSEGALVGAIAAQAVKPDFFVSLAGASESAAQTLRRQLKGALPPSLAQANEQILASLERGELVADVPKELLLLYRPSVQPYFISWIKRNPSVEYAKLTVPTLIVQGTADELITLRDAGVLHEALPSSRLTLISGMNHALMIAPSEDGASGAKKAPLSVSKELLKAIGLFLGRGSAR